MDIFIMVLSVVGLILGLIYTIVKIVLKTIEAKNVRRKIEVPLEIEKMKIEEKKHKVNKSFYNFLWNSISNVKLNVNELIGIRSEKDPRHNESLELVKVCLGELNTYCHKKMTFFPEELNKMCFKYIDDIKLIIQIFSVPLNSKDWHDELVQKIMESNEFYDLIANKIHKYLSI